MEVKIVPMMLGDVNGVLDVERTSFSTPWSREAFVSEVMYNCNAFYLVAKLENKIIGYVGTWIILDEAHVTNVAVHSEYRRQHVGEKLLVTLIEEMKKRDVIKMTLEVRVSNVGAQKLYEKLGFVSVGIRPGYYQNNAEDAVIMWKDPL